MGDTSIVYSDAFGLRTFQREIVAALGEDFFNELTEGLCLPDIATECTCKCKNMKLFMERLESKVDPEIVKQILIKVRHGLKPSQSAYARDHFLEEGDLDRFLKKNLDDQIAYFKTLNKEKKDFYGDSITDDALQFLLENPSILAPIRVENKLYIRAFPNRMQNFLSAKDPEWKRYYACHCPFAKESIKPEFADGEAHEKLEDSSKTAVSATLCNCSLGHVMNFVEAFLDRTLKGRVVKSVLNGDLSCEYEIDIPDDIMEQYVKEN